MSKKRRKLTDDHLDEEEMDAILGDAIEAKFDAELRADLAKSLKQDYHFSRKTQTIALEGRRNNRLFFLRAIAAGLALLILAWSVLRPSADNPQELASAYLETTEIYHSGSLKGNTHNEEIRMQAIRSFNAGAYVQAQEYFSRIEEKTEEDIFYSGIASLYAEKYEEAIVKLESQARSESRFQEEAIWYLAITYILHGDMAAAKDLLSKIESSAWNYNKSQKLLESLE